MKLHCTLSTVEAESLIRDYRGYDSVKIHDEAPTPVPAYLSTMDVYQAARAARVAQKTFAECGGLRGNWKIPTIKAVRAEVRLGLAEAKHFVEALFE